MKVGDMVKQNYNLVQFDGKAPGLTTQKPTKEMFGIVLEIVDRRDKIPKKFSKWGEYLGRSITVMWTNGKITTSIAEHALETIDENG
jgi:hypothetical protein